MTHDHRAVDGGQLVQSEHGRSLQICATELGFRRIQTKSEGINAVGNTEEMYATSTSGIGPIGPARTSTGRSFIPAISPNGKLARQISPGLIYGLAVRQSVNVLPRVSQLVTPGPGNVPWP